MFEYHYNYLHYYFPLYYIIMREREREKLFGMWSRGRWDGFCFFS